MSIHPRPIGSGAPALSPAAFQGVTMTPRVAFNERGVREVFDSKRAQALASLEPCADEDAMLPKLVLELLPEQMAELRRLTDDLVEAKRQAVEAEQRHTAAERIARTLPGLLDRSGQAAARSIGGDKFAKDAVKHLVDQIDEARLAESALKTLADEMNEAKRAADRAFGHLRVYAVRAVKGMSNRAAAEYARLGEQMRQCVGAIDAVMGLLHKDTEVAAIAASWHTQYMAALRLPALPASLRHGAANGIESANGIDMLIAPLHSYLRGCSNGTRSKLITQLGEATAPAGLGFNNLL